MAIPDMPTTILDIHIVCNQTCVYCVSGSAPTNNFGPIAEPETLRNLEQFFETYGPFNVLFTGGEPLITPNISDIFRMLIERGHLISLQSNLKSRVESFIDTVPPEKVGWVLSSFHSVELKRFQNYLKNVMKVKEKGYPLVVKLVLDNDLMAEFTTVYDTLDSNGLGIMLSPVIDFPPGGPSWPKQYTPQQWSLIEPRISLLSSWLYFAGGFKSLGIACNAGRHLSLIRMADGAIHGCGHSFPENFGNVTRNKFSPPKGAIKCGLPQCVCDFHYYTGIIPAVDDSQQFNKLLAGKMEMVPFSAYLDWITDKGIEPIIDLQAEMNGQPRKTTVLSENWSYIPLEQIGIYEPSHPYQEGGRSYLDLLGPGQLRSTLSKAAYKVLNSARNLNRGNKDGL